ncbi:unnamed protein product [Ixodes pacificus]
MQRPFVEQRQHFFTPYLHSKRIATVTVLNSVLLQSASHVRLSRTQLPTIRKTQLKSTSPSLQNAAFLPFRTAERLPHRGTTTDRASNPPVRLTALALSVVCHRSKPFHNSGVTPGIKRYPSNLARVLTYCR